MSEVVRQLQLWFAGCLLESNDSAPIAVSRPRCSAAFDPLGMTRGCFFPFGLEKELALSIERVGMFR
jgi:hypothetical protein